jgi:hypothetical protein
MSVAIVLSPVAGRRNRDLLIGLISLEQLVKRRQVTQSRRSERFAGMIANERAEPFAQFPRPSRFSVSTAPGPQAILDNLLVPLSGDWDGFSAKAHEFIAEGDRVVSLGTYSGTFKKTGRSFSAAFAHVWTVRGDKLVRFDMHTDTVKVLEAMQ